MSTDRNKNTKQTLQLPCRSSLDSVKRSGAPCERLSLGKYSANEPVLPCLELTFGEAIFIRSSLMLEGKVQEYKCDANREISTTTTTLTEKSLLPI